MVERKPEELSAGRSNRPRPTNLFVEWGLAYMGAHDRIMLAEILGCSSMVEQAPYKGPTLGSIPDTPTKR